MVAVPVTEAFWNDLQADLRQVLPAELYSTWFKPLRFAADGEDTLVVQAPSSFSAIFVEDNYADLIRERACALAEGMVDVVFEVTVPEPAEASAPTESPPPNRLAVPPAPFERSSIHRNKHREQEDARKRKVFLNPRNTFDNFIIGPSNQLAHAAAVAVAAEPGKSYNPLFIYGETGLGKTHLMQAIAHGIQQNDPDARVVYLSSEKFTNKFLKAIRENTVDEFRRIYRKVDVLLIDDVQFLQKKERTQEEFFHTFNDLFESQRQVCLSSDRPASEMTDLESRLVSRFQWGMVCDIQAPDLETRTAILRKKAVALGHANLPDRVLAFLAERITRNVRRLEGALLTVAAYTRLHGNDITEARLQSLIGDILAQESQLEVTIERIQRFVVAEYGLKMGDMSSRKRPANIAFPRQIAMYLSRLLTNHPLKEIGEAFGGRDHGTVIHACKTIEHVVERKQRDHERIETLRKRLSGEIVV